MAVVRREISTSEVVRQSPRMPRRLKVDDVVIFQLSIWCGATGKSGVSYYWEQGSTSGNFDVATSQRSLSIFGVKHPRYAIFSVTTPPRHPKPPAKMIDVLFELWKRGVKKNRIG